ncbi:MAG: hypothetical protein WA842_12665, partial [Croceibacterium sp.]
ASRRPVRRRRGIAMPCARSPRVIRVENSRGRAGNPEPELAGEWSSGQSSQGRAPARSARSQVPQQGRGNRANAARPVGKRLTPC